MTTSSVREQSSRLAELLRREHHALADLLVALSEFDRARGWEELGYASLFDFLHRKLGLSKGAAFYRMTAARLVQEHPAVIAPVRDGRLCLTSVVALSKALTAGKLEDVLPRLFGLSTREAKAVTAELVPEARVPLRTVVTAAATPAPSLALRRLAPDAPPGACSSLDLGQLVGQANQQPPDSAMSAGSVGSGPAVDPSRISTRSSSRSRSPRTSPASTSPSRGAFSASSTPLATRSPTRIRAPPRTSSSRSRSTSSSPGKRSAAAS